MTIVCCALLLPPPPPPPRRDTTLFILPTTFVWRICVVRKWKENVGVVTRVKRKRKRPLRGSRVGGIFAAHKCGISPQAPIKSRKNIYTSSQESQIPRCQGGCVRLPLPPTTVLPYPRRNELDILAKIIERKNPHFLWCGPTSPPPPSTPPTSTRLPTSTVHSSFLNDNAKDYSPRSCDCLGQVSRLRTRSDSTISDARLSLSCSS